MPHVWLIPRVIFVDLQTKSGVTSGEETLEETKETATLGAANGIKFGASGNERTDIMRYWDVSLSTGICSDPSSNSSRICKKVYPGEDGNDLTWTESEIYRFKIIAFSSPYYPLIDRLRSIGLEKFDSVQSCTTMYDQAYALLGKCADVMGDTDTATELGCDPSVATKDGLCSGTMHGLANVFVKDQVDGEQKKVYAIEATGLTPGGSNCSTSASLGMELCCDCTDNKAVYEASVVSTIDVADCEYWYATATVRNPPHPPILFNFQLSYLLHRICWHYFLRLQ